YCFIYSFTFLLDFFREILPSNTKNNVKRKFRVAMPVFLTIFIPYNALMKINKYLNSDSNSNNYDPDDIPDYEEKKSDIEPDVEIFIHVTEEGFGAVGHMDIYYNKEIISYGNYDDSSLKLFKTVGDGVIFIADKSTYLPFCIENSKKTLFSFGLKLTDEQKQNLKKQIDKVKNNLYIWDPPVLKAFQKDHKNHDKTKYTDYASELYNATGAKFYKFYKGKFKTYFVLGTNCVLLSDTLIGKVGTDIIKLNGVISPGAYFDFLNKEFSKKKSLVITKRVYK
ncbi:MAG: hypothetical protein ACRCZK_03945, partial [Oscillospiraceae bacterium]